MTFFTSMSTLCASTWIYLLFSAICVSAHGHVTQVIINGVAYGGYLSTSFPLQRKPPVVLGWTIEQRDNGFVSPDKYGHPDIICHRDATPAQGHVQVAAGDTITIKWSSWPENHRGPVLDYLANCNGPCETVDKTKLEFFKIDGMGLISQGRPGKYADGALRDNGYTWSVRIPSNIAPGNYVLRHEIIALHSGLERNGAQNYPQCFNLKITGSGSDKPAGYLGTELYKANDPGILVNVYASPLNYQVPGPTIVRGGVTSIRQSPSRATTTDKCTTRS
ncbi:Endoglucanase-4 [Fusarium sp. AF-6]|nr:Endoglucanase-4 [Fusarium sp. AF-6]